MGDVDLEPELAPEPEAPLSLSLSLSVGARTRTTWFAVEDVQLLRSWACAVLEARPPARRPEPASFHS